MVAPLVEALLVPLVLRVLRRRDDEAAHPAPNRLVGDRQDVDSIGYVAAGTSVLLRRRRAGVEVLPAGSLVLPALLGRCPATYEVVTHAPVDVWLRVGPFETLDGRSVHQVELRLTVAIGSSAAGLRELAGPSGRSDHEGDHEADDGLGAVLLDRLAREVTDRTTDAVRRRTLRDLTSLSLGVLLDGSLPTAFLGGLVERSDLEVLDVDWPTEGHGWRPTLVPVPAPLPEPGADDPGRR